MKFYNFFLFIPRGKKQVVFLFGDYEFLCKIYGIAGASGKYVHLVQFSSVHLLALINKL